MTEFPPPVNGKNMARTPLHETARRYAEAGIPIFPCRVGGKEPVTHRGFKDATTDLAVIDTWWNEADWNIGLEPEKAGWAVIDIDNLETWENLSERVREGTTASASSDNGGTYTVATPRGGRHLYFQGSLPGSVGKLGRGIDTRGRGSYVLVPPSIVAGRHYTVLDDRDPAPLPAWIAERLGHSERTRAEAPANVTWDDPETVAWAIEFIKADIVKNGEPIDGGLG